MAKAICGGCAVRGQCLKFAVERGEAHGIWGGTSESERRVLIGAA
jgi:WhiB family redox-sensing transcriptional regulator